MWAGKRDMNSIQMKNENVFVLVFPRLEHRSERPMLYAFNMRLPFGTLQAVVLYIGLRLVSHLTREYVNPHKSFLIFKLTGSLGF
jgi:hypothetical protein